MIAGSNLIFLKFIWNMSCISAAQLKCWFQTDLGRENSASYYRQGRQLLLTLLTIITLWSRSSPNVYAVFDQNLTGEFMRKIYAASWILFTLTAEADRFLCQLVMFFTVFLHWIYKWNSATIRSLLLFSDSLFVGFWLRNASLVKVGNPISVGIVFVFHLAWRVRGLQSLKRYWPCSIPFRSCVSNGKPE